MRVLSHSATTHTHTPCQDPELEGSHGLEKVTIDEILEAQRVAQEKEQAEKKKRDQLLHSRGMRPLDHSEYDS